MSPNKSQKIKAVLKESGISQTDLAQKLGISRQQLHGILKENRKSKYLDQIAQLLKLPELAKDKLFQATALEGKFVDNVQHVPLVLPEDILRIWEGHQTINQLSKPFYNLWPFVVENPHTPDHFCLQINDYLHNTQGYTIGAFHLYLPLQLSSGRIVLIYLKALKKLTLGTLEINPETKTRSIVNSNGIYTLGIDDIIIAECVQTTTFLSTNKE